MATFKTGFFAYPSSPLDLRTPIERAVAEIDQSRTAVKAWPFMSTFGAVIPEEVRTDIDCADVLLCDITIPNPNVYYEIGYAIGKGKPIAPVLNATFADVDDQIQQDGIFDIIGYKRYENSEELKSAIYDVPDKVLLNLYSQPLNRSQPIYVLTALRKSNFITAISAAVKESGAFFRSFDPAEESRLSTIQMIGRLSASAGVIIPFIGSHIDDAERHNTRASFLAGMSHGLGKETLLISHQVTEEHLPTDYRHDVSAVKFERDIEPLVANLVKNAQIVLQSRQPVKIRHKATLLQRLNIGAIAAENEFKVLEDYFVETSEYLRAERGDAGIVAGRKGSGKTAIFFMVRDAFRRHKKSIVIDLRPESHQLSLFRSELLKIMDAGAFDHTLAAFWYFLILTEILIALKRSLSYQSARDPRRHSDVLEISEELDKLAATESGDFTTRINRLSSQIALEISSLEKKGKSIGPDELTNIIFKKGISDAKNLISKHSSASDQIILLFDNIDKGWALSGVDSFDIRLVRLLLESLDKVRSDLVSMHRNFFSIVFLRNDVLELLVDSTPDRGKASIVRIDWKDRAKLRQVIYKRLQIAIRDTTSNFYELWTKFFTREINGKDSFEFLADHCLMRPRFLLHIIENAIANAIDRGHEFVGDADCLDAVKQHSNYLLSDFGYEIRDVSGISPKILLSLVGTSQHLTRSEVIERFSARSIAPGREMEAFKLMLWYGALGIVTKSNSERYIYDFDYSIDRMEAEIESDKEESLFVTNPAFHVALQTA